MTVGLFTRSKVKDFDVWKEMYDAGAEFVKQQGVIASNVLRDLDDPNVIIVHHQFADAETAKAFEALVNSDMFRKGDPVVKGGVILDTMEIWLGEEA